MFPRPYLLALLLLLMPVIAMMDGLAMAPMAALLFLLLAWRERRALAGWRAMYQTETPGLIIVLLLAVWPILTTLWSIIPHVSLATSLRSAALLLLAFIGIFLAKRQKNVMDRALWALPALGIVLASLIIATGQLPQGGLIATITQFTKHDELDYLSRDINRGLCALTVLVWPATLGLARLGNRKLAVLLPWALALTVFSLHSLSAKTGLIAGMITLYGMMLCPKATRRILLWAIPLAFATWPLLFQWFELTWRDALWPHLPMSSQHRVEIWHFALEKWQERPWLGWGVDSSRAIPGGLEEVWPGLVKLPLHPHNLALNVLLEEGIIGFALFFLALWLFVRRVLPDGSGHNPMVSGAKAATLVSYLTIGLSGFGMWQGWWIATGVAALLIAAFAEEAKIA